MTSKNNDNPKRKRGEEQKLDNVNDVTNVNFDKDTHDEILRKLVVTMNLLVKEYAEHKKYVKECNEKFASLDKSLKKIEKDLSDLKGEVADIEGRVDEVEGQIDS